MPLDGSAGVRRVGRARRQEEIAEAAGRAELALALQPGPPGGAAVGFARAGEVVEADARVGHLLAGLGLAVVAQVEVGLPLAAPDIPEYFQRVCALCAHGRTPPVSS